MIDNWDELLGFCDLGVSDVFISGELGFDLKRVSEVVHEKGIQIRAYPNVCQSAWGINEDGFKSFYIRPEDIDTYGQYIDIIEFQDFEGRQNILYETYFHSKEWNGNIQELIHGLKKRVNGYYILGSEFGNRRAKCQRKCLKGERGCHLCDSLVELAETIEKSKKIELFK